MLELHNVSFAHGPRTIFHDLRVTVKRGEMVALLGPNGVGKTTLLKVIAGLLPPASGTVVIENRALHLWTRSEISRYVSLVPQELELPFAFRVEEIVAQGRVPHLGFFGGLRSHDREAVERAMEAVDILRLRNRVFAELSGGERQRVKIAIGLAQEAHLMLLDEPTQHLDIGRQVELISLLRRLNESGITIVAAMHDLALVREGFLSSILLTPEPGYMTGPTAELLRPELLERAFCVDRSRLQSLLAPAAGGILEAHPENIVHDAETSPARAGATTRSRRHRVMGPGKTPRP